MQRPRRGDPRAPRPRRGPATAGRGGATSTATPRRRRVAVAPVAALALVLGQGGLVLAGLLLAGGPGAAAEAPVLAPLADPPAPLAAAAPRAPAPSPESEAGSPPAAGKAKKLDGCAIVTVFAGKTCKVKKDGKVLVVKDPTVIVQKPVVDGEDTVLSPNRFAKQYAATYPSSAAGPTANVTFTGQPVVAAELDGVRFQKPASGNAKLKFKVAPRGRKGYQFALAAVDPATDQCEIEFLTPCKSAACTYAEKKCAAGAVCPGGTAVSAECADPAGAGNPCACTALQQLAGMSDELRAEAPWNDLANQKYCGAERDFDDYKDGSLNVLCESVDGVLLPSFVNGELSGLAGALPRSLGDLGPSMTYLTAGSNLITSVPTEIGMLTALGGLKLANNTLATIPTEIADLTRLTELLLFENFLTEAPAWIGGLDLTELDLGSNQLTGVPTEFRTWGPEFDCFLDGNPRGGGGTFSCANVGRDTTCCTADNCGSTSTCYTPPPRGCTYTDTTCAAGAVCPGGTAVSVECADRSDFSESPCACTALQQLAALSQSVSSQGPWSDLASAAYCQDNGPGTLRVVCAPVDGVQLPTLVDGTSTFLAGALPSSIGELGPSLTSLQLWDNAITSLPIEVGDLTGLTKLDLTTNELTSMPTELAALTGLTYLYLDNNQLTGVPTEFHTVNPSVGCYLFNNPGFSCANVGFGTSCCTGAGPPGNQCGEGLSGGPCYAG